jgi:hypothetical protein
VDEMLENISSRLLTEWMAFSSLEPFGYEAEMHGNAVTSSVIANANRDEKKKPDPFTTQDFLPHDEEEAEDKPSVFQRLKEYFQQWQP